MFRIEAVKNFRDVKKSDKGGFVENEHNLSHDRDCWIYGKAKVYSYANVYDNAIVDGYAEVYDHAKIYNNAHVFDIARVVGISKVCGDCEVFGDTEVCGNALIKSMSDYIVFKNWRSSGRYFTWTRNNNMWSVRCFFGTGEELIAKAYKDSELSGREYERVVRYVESIINEDRI